MQSPKPPVSKRGAWFRGLLTVLVGMGTDFVSRAASGPPPNRWQLSVFVVGNVVAGAIVLRAFMDKSLSQSEEMPSTPQEAAQVEASSISQGDGPAPKE